jgi:hypothetical protein
VEETRTMKLQERSKRQKLMRVQTNESREHHATPATFAVSQEEKRAKHNNTECDDSRDSVTLFRMKNRKAYSGLKLGRRIIQLEAATRVHINFPQTVQSFKKTFLNLRGENRKQALTHRYPSLTRYERLPAESADAQKRLTMVLVMEEKRGGGRKKKKEE